MARTLLDKVWQAHTVTELSSGQTQLLIGLHLIHEVTSPQAFAMLRDAGLPVRFPHRTFATIDHIIPTHNVRRPYADALAEEMVVHLERNCAEAGITFLSPESGLQGIVHVVGPELGLTQPGMTIACGDSHTATHGAFGALAFGIGTSQVRDILVTGTMAMAKPALRRISIDGELPAMVTAKDVILTVIRRLGANGGVGFAYEYGGSTVGAMNMEQRLTICNMSIEGAARIGYINPDEETFKYLRGRRYAPPAASWDDAVAWWKSMSSDPDAQYDDVVEFNAAEICPMVTWGINPGQCLGVDETIPREEEVPEHDRGSWREAMNYMSWTPGQPIAGTPIDVAFIGSCTNGRISDLRAAAEVLKGRRIAAGVTALVVPGSMAVLRQAEEEGLHEVFTGAGCQWRRAGCSMCLAMNPDRLIGRQVCASSSNRNFKGRQGSPTGRTLLMSPEMVAAAAVTGHVVDIRRGLE